MIDVPEPQPTSTRRRRVNLRAVILAGVAIPLIAVTLLGLEPLPLLPDDLNTAITEISQSLVQLLVVVGALAVVIGILNLIGAQVRNVRRMPRGLYALVTLVTMFSIIVLRLIERAGGLAGGEGDFPVAPSLTLMDALQVTIESALAGLLFFFLVYAAYRMMRRGVTLWNVLFMAALVVVLLGYNTLNGMGFLTAIRDWLLAVPVNAGVRGLLIGIAIGTLAVGVRLLIGQDRTFRE
jgi:hypothetical protein